MRAIIIGAGRGRRLMPVTADLPKCFAEVAGKKIIDWTLEAFRENDIHDILFIGGYRIETVRSSYSELEFRHNEDWENNNILESLFCAEDLMDEPFICCYSDILFTPKTIKRLLADDKDMALVVDTEWLVRYEHRSDHPSSDAEKVTARNGLVTRVHREIEENEAYGEYIGVSRFSAAGARRLRHHYHRCKEQFSGRPWREAPVFEKAYKIHLFQEMIEADEQLGHVDTPGGYIEIDTQQDFEYARKYWITRHLGR
jgi:choline kinase